MVVGGAPIRALYLHSLAPYLLATVRHTLFTRTFLLRDPYE